MFYARGGHSCSSRVGVSGGSWLCDGLDDARKLWTPGKYQIASWSFDICLTLLFYVLEVRSPIY